MFKGQEQDWNIYFMSIMLVGQNSGENQLVLLIFHHVDPAFSASQDLFIFILTY